MRCGAFLLPTLYHFIDKNCVDIAWPGAAGKIIMFKQESSIFCKDWHSKTEETFQAVIETEKRVLENLHKTISKQKQEFMKPKTETVIVEATVSQEDDFLLTSKETNYETHVSAVYDKQTGGSVGVPMENNASTDAASTSSYITEGEESAEESSNLKRGSKEKFPKEKINQMAVMSALRRDNKRFCSHCEKFKVLYSLPSFLLDSFACINSLRELTIAVSAEFAFYEWITIALG